MSIEFELAQIEPNAKQVRLGSHSVYRFQTVTPAHTFISVIKPENSGKVIQLTARDSFADTLAQHLLDQMDKIDLGDQASECIRVHPFACPDPWKFDVVVVAPPLVAKRFEHQSKALSRATFWIVPAFSQEFRDKDSDKTFWHQLGRKDGWRVHVIDWNREFKTERKWE